MNLSSSDIPQANLLDLIVDVVTFRYSPTLSTEDVIEAIRIRTGKTYRPRQANYYADAAVCFGLLQADLSGYSRTQAGNRLKEAKQGGEQDMVLKEAMMSSPLIRSLAHEFISEDAKIPSIRDISIWLRAHSRLSESTLTRRSSSLRRYVEFLVTTGDSNV